MIDFKGLFCALLFVVVVPQWTVAQNNTNSPYTRYGYGQLSDQNFANSKAMGGESLTDYETGIISTRLTRLLTRL